MKVGRLLSFELFYVFFLLLLPTQFGKHFWPSFSEVLGIRVDYLSPTVYVTDIIVVCLFFSVLFSKKRSLLYPQTKRSQIIVLCMVLFFILNCVISSQPLLSLYGVFRISEVVFIALVTREVVQKVSVLSLFAFTLMWESVLALWQFVHQGAVGGLLYFLGERMITPETPGAANTSIHGQLLLRPYGTFSHPNQLAGFLLVIVVVLLFRNKELESQKIRYLHISAIICGSIGILLSMSRMAILLFILFFIYYLVRERIFSNKKLLITSFVGIIAILLVSVGIGLDSRFVHLFSDQSLKERQVLFQSAQEMFSHNVLFGVGLLQFIPQLPSYTASSQYLYFLQPVHDIYYLWLNETGLIGALLAVFLISLFLKRFIQLKARELFLTKASVGAALVVICSLGVVDHYFYTLYQTQLLVGIIVGLALGIISRPLSHAL